MTPARLFEGKRVLVFGVANDRSIAWGIAQAMHEHGATLGFTYAGEAFEKRVRPLAESVGSELIMPCDVTNEAEVEAVFA
jgi:enoyl-[acyl-carrier protein] reductase I